MNYLAHFYLAHETAASRAGNFLGDFITGTPESLAESLPSELVDGIMMHRRIDAFTDSHPNFKAGKKLLSPERHRFSGIILDMFTDHFLAHNWEAYAKVSLLDFTKEIATNMQEYWEYFPENAQREAIWMIEGDWFGRYQTIEGLEKSLTGISKSRKKFDPIAGSSEHLQSHYDQFQKLCHELLTDTKQMDY